ncbi:Testican-1 [Fukomys damarensis]|uniref:Testican-1 n=1 Tax=Fukomys damarensis TaxID=885580 RepID=A0A091CKN3_FUKDA|nr:Testican-1 [Fukomys damarensis]
MGLRSEVFMVGVSTDLQTTRSDFSIENPELGIARHPACTDKELRNLASRLKDWFGALHEDANRVIKPTSSDTAQGRFDTSILPICKDSLGWMFNKLDMNYDLLLDHSEINAIYLDKYEPCIKPLFNSCDSFKDGKLSNNEWCYCFQKPGGLPCQNEMNRIQKLSKGKSLLGAFIPRCNEEGYYKATQCHGSTGQCWCVDKYGNELAGSRKQGAVSCEEEQETSGDFGSGGSVVLLDDLEDEQELGPKGKEGKLKVHTRSVTEDDEDEDDDKDDEVGYIW